jgi:hypothetical protein
MVCQSHLCCMGQWCDGLVPVSACDMREKTQDTGRPHHPSTVNELSLEVVSVAHARGKG